MKWWREAVTIESIEANAKQFFNDVKWKNTHLNFRNKIIVGFDVSVMIVQLIKTHYLSLFSNKSSISFEPIIV